MPEPSAVRDRGATTLPQLEAARVAAMAAIFLFHLWSVVPEGVGSGWASVALSQGYLGVVVFNVIAGLVLAWPHLGPERRPLPTWPGFLRRRFLRIVPAYYLALALSVAVAAGVARRAPSPASVVSHVLFLHTLSPAEFFTIVPAYWWLGLLAQFYCTFLLVLRFHRAVGPWRGVALVCAASWGGWLLLDAVARPRPGSTSALINYLAYYNLPYRLPEFAIGIGLASSIRSEADGRPPGLPPAAVATLVGLSALVFAFGGAFPELAPVAHVRLVAACIAPFVGFLALPTFRRAGSTAFIARLAAASYSFYLLHQPILGYGVEALGATLGPRLTFWVLLVGVGVLAFELSRLLDRAASWIVAWLDRPRGT